MKIQFKKVIGKKYGEHLKDYVGRILLVGINYDKNDENKIHTCVIEELEKTK